MDKVKLRARLISGETKLVWHNISNFLLGASMAISAYYNYSTAYHAHLSVFELKIRIAASVVVGLYAAYALGQWLKNKEVR